MDKIEPGKSPFTQLHHVGAIVKDAEKTAKILESLGMETFKPNVVVVSERLIKGKRSTDFKAKAIQAHVGPVRLELVQPIQGDSPQKDFLEQKGEGFHHLAFLVSNIDKHETDMVKKGLTVNFRSRYLNGGATTYLETDKVGGVLFELFQRPSNYVPHK